jgi:hypothetical protein
MQVMAGGTFKRQYKPKEKNEKKLEIFLKKVEDGRIKLPTLQGRHV